MDDTIATVDPPVRPPSRKAYVWIAAVGLLLALGGGTVMLVDTLLALNARAADSVVTGYSGFPGRSHPVIEYTDASGNVHSISAGSNASLSVGDHAPVLYDPAAPDVAIVDTFGARWMTPMCFTVFGLLLAALALASLRKLKRTGTV